MYEILTYAKFWADFQEVNYSEWKNDNSKRYNYLYNIIYNLLYIILYITYNYLYNILKMTKFQKERAYQRFLELGAGEVERGGWVWLKKMAK